MKWMPYYVLLHGLAAVQATSKHRTYIVFQLSTDYNMKQEPKTFIVV